MYVYIYIHIVGWPALSRGVYNSNDSNANSYNSIV